MVYIDGDVEISSLWTNARDYVDSTYGRLKLLKQLVAEQVIWIFSSYEELAQMLDQAYKTSKLARKYRARPAFTPVILRAFSQTWGGKRHRRHIIMSSAMREAVYSVTDTMTNDRQQVLNTYNALISKVGLSQLPDIDTAETVLVQVLHNNPANLVLDMGPWNSAIGGFATNIRNTLSQDSAVLWQQYRAQGEQFLQGQVKGFQVGLQQQIMDFWLEYARANPPQDADDLQELLISMYDNAAFDLLSKQSLPNTQLMPDLMRCHTAFEHARATKSLADLRTACEQFIALGLSYKPVPYASVFN